MVKSMWKRNHNKLNNQQKFEVWKNYKMPLISGRKFSAAGNWKSLQISSQLRDQGLLGIEELTDYSLVKVKKKTPKISNGNNKVQEKATTTAVVRSSLIRHIPEINPQRACAQ